MLVGNTITGNGTVPSGGASGNVLSKNTGTDYDVSWTLPSGGGGNVSTSGTITTGQYPRWASGTTIESVPVSTVRSDLGLVIGTNVQAYDADLDTWATKTPYAGAVTITTGKTFNCTGNLTLAGTDGSTLNVGAGGTLGTGAFAALVAPAGSDTHVQFKDGTVFGGDSGMVYDKTNDRLTVAGKVFAGAAGASGNGFYNGTQATQLSSFQSWNFGSTYTFFCNNKHYLPGTGWADLGLARVGSGFQFDGDKISFIHFDTGVTQTGSIACAPLMLGLGSNCIIGFSATVDATAAKDVGFGRNAVGVVEINNGTAGQYRDLKCDEVDAVTGYKINGAAAAGKILVGNGTDYVASTPTFPNASATARKFIVSDGTNWVASTETQDAPGTAGSILTSDGTNWKSRLDILSNQATALQGGASGFQSDTYVTGSGFTVPANTWTVGTTYRITIFLSKTAAGNQAMVFNCRIGTAGTTSDFAVYTGTFLAGSGVADAGRIDFFLVFTVIGGSATTRSTMTAMHNLTSTGLFSTGAVSTQVGVNVTSGTFSSTAATKIGISINGGTSISLSVEHVQAHLNIA